MRFGGTRRASPAFLPVAPLAVLVGDGAALSAALCVPAVPLPVFFVRLRRRRPRRRPCGRRGSLLDFGSCGLLPGDWGSSGFGFMPSWASPVFVRPDWSTWESACRRCLRRRIAALGPDPSARGVAFPGAARLLPGLLAVGLLAAAAAPWLFALAGLGLSTALDSLAAALLLFRLRLRALSATLGIAALVPWACSRFLSAAGSGSEPCAGGFSARASVFLATWLSPGPCRRAALSDPACFPLAIVLAALCRAAVAGFGPPVVWSFAPGLLPVCFFESPTSSALAVRPGLLAAGRCFSDFGPPRRIGSAGPCSPPACFDRASTGRRNSGRFASRPKILFGALLPPLGCED